MRAHEQDLLQRCIDRLRELPFVKEAALLPPPGRDVEPFRLSDGGREALWDGRVRIVTPNGTEFRIVRTDDGWDGRLIIEGGPTIEKYGHTPGAVVHVLAHAALVAAKAPAESVK